jgi:hypothetical protein
MRAATSHTQTRFTILLVSTQPLAEGWPRDAEAAAHRARISKCAICLDPPTPLALRTILDFNHLRKPFTNVDAVAVGLWATRSVVHQVHSLPDLVKRCL